MPAAFAADRLERFETLVSDYDAAYEKWSETAPPRNPTPDERIDWYDRWPCWEHFPRLLKLAEEKPDDEAAYRCCRRIVDQTRDIRVWDRRAYLVEQRAWAILLPHHTDRDGLPRLCLQAANNGGTPASEAFLRGLLGREGLPHDHRGFATVALAEMLAQRIDWIQYRERRRRYEEKHPPDDFFLHLRQKRTTDWPAFVSVAKVPRHRAESVRLFRRVIVEFGDVHVTISEPSFRDLNSLGEKARKSLHALEHLGIGAPAPEIVGVDLRGEPLRLSDQRDKVVVLSFWFTACGPCMAMVPEKKQLVETYRDAPFALLGVCRDKDPQQARETAAAQGMTWRNWSDGEDDAITRDWNVLGWPTVYVIDRRGRIAAKEIRGDELRELVAELVELPVNE